MLPSLSSLGIDEVEPRVCADSAQNRALLRAAEMKFKIATPGFIEVYADRAEKDTELHERNKLILVDPRDPWSDFVPFTELPLDYTEVAPAWMQRLLNKYNDAVDSGTPVEKLPHLPVRCRRRRADGGRCWVWSWPGPAAEDFCRYHAPIGSFDYGAQFQKLTDAAKARLVGMQGAALDALEELVTDRSTVPAVRLRAAESIFDRSGLAAKQDITVSGTVTHEAIDPAQAIRDRLSALAERSLPELEAASESEPLLASEEVVEGEIVHDNN